MAENTFFAILAWLIGNQIYNKDFLLLTGKYNYNISLAQLITYTSAVLAIFSLYGTESITQIIVSIIAVGIAFLSEYILSRLSFNRGVCTISYRICFVCLTCGVMTIFTDNLSYFPFFLMGWYVRNCMFGVPHRKSLVVAELFKHHIKMPKNVELVEVTIPEGMPDFSHAGNNSHDIKGLKRYDVSEYDIYPNTGEDLIIKVQKLIDTVGQKGGGIIYFPKGKYQFNKNGRKEFLQINYNNVIIEGETDEKGHLLTELINCGSTVHGERNPWLSPFFITTGEQIQRSNIFFGLQFRKRKKTFMRSGSMSDPGSDGEILTPSFATKVIKNSSKGDDIIHVEDSSQVGKYVMLGMYNVNGDNSLLKDILGQDEIRPAWQAASRADEEEAPSFQWLIEVKEIIDDHSIRLKQPLWRDCDMKYEPTISNVPMLEHITIRNLRINCTWNGMFRHHGHKRYYRVDHAQEMDYGWNGINMKRVAYGNIENVTLENFTNPLYVMDSRNVTCEHITIKGHDGHQGIKIYEHACDNLFRDIKFYNHYADMMGGEGNAYGNVFTDVRYLNPCFKPVHYDFHGFSEGPMSPPSYNLFDNVHGFSYISSSGSEHMMPSCGRTNVWWNCVFEGEKKGSLIFSQRYKSKLSAKSKFKLFVKSVLTTLKHRRISVFSLNQNYRDLRKKYQDIWVMSYQDISKLYSDFYLYGIHTKCNMEYLNHNLIHIIGLQKYLTPKHLC